MASYSTSTRTMTRKLYAIRKLNTESEYGYIVYEVGRLAGEGVSVREFGRYGDAVRYLKYLERRQEKNHAN